MTARDWAAIEREADRLAAALQALIAPVGALFEGDASQPKQARRLTLVHEALERVRVRAARELETAAALKANREERAARLDDWRERRDAMAAQRARERHGG